MSDRIVYYAEAIGGGRGVLRRDVIVCGELVPEMTGTVGSPAPMAVVREHERTVLL